MDEILSLINSYVWGWPMIALLLGTHLFLTFRLKVPQRRIWTAIKLSVTPDKKSTGDVSQFGVLATSLAATIGTGNIIGVATAVALGGPGSVFWCWLIGLFGIATKYSEGLLAVHFRQKTNDGRMLGGPMFALERGLGMKRLAVLFSIFTAIAALGIGNTVQANAISVNIASMLDGVADPDLCHWIVGIVTSVLVGIVIFGGVKSITRICSLMIPFMAVFYVVGCVYVLIVNSSYLWDSICWIVSDAFSFDAAIGGTAGVAIMTTMRYGMARGLFSNESGMGSAPIVAAAAQTKNSVRQALVLSSGAFWDTAVICTLTGLVIVSSVLASHGAIDIKDEGNLTIRAFEAIPYIGAPLLSFGIITFAFSTLLGWGYYGERAIEYLFGLRFIPYYRVLWVLLVIVGSVVSLKSVWNFADITNALMAVPNLISLLFLSHLIARETQHYLWDDHLDEESDS